MESKDCKSLSELMNRQRENLKELFKLIEERPDLPIVAMVDGELVADDCYSRWLGSWGSAYIDKYLPHENGMIFYDSGNPDVVDVFEKYFDYDKCGIDEELPDSEALPLMREKIDSLDWIEAIIVEINLPDLVLCGNEEG